jgi:acrylyl-CoA reductase (NADPH)
MAVGSAGLTAAMSLNLLEDHGLRPENGPVLITGAAGGVGSVATALLAAQGYEVAAVTGRPEQESYLRDLGARRIIPRADLNEVIRKPLESETWAGCIDSVGGAMLARLLGQMQYGASVAAVGLAGGTEVPAKIVPFLLRAVNLLGVDSVLCPYQTRLRAWERIAHDLPMDKLRAMEQPATLADLPELGARILKGQVRGRVVIDVNA